MANGSQDPVPGTVSILLDNGDGPFQPPMSLLVGSAPRSVAVGDFNGDGKPDAAVAVSNSHSVAVLINASK